MCSTASRYAATVARAEAEPWLSRSPAAGAGAGPVDAGPVIDGREGGWSGARGPEIGGATAAPGYSRPFSGPEGLPDSEVRPRRNASARSETTATTTTPIRRLLFTLTLSTVHREVSRPSSFGPCFKRNSPPTVSQIQPE